jgi:hypothetical protein
MLACQQYPRPRLSLSEPSRAHNSQFFGSPGTSLAQCRFVVRDVYRSHSGERDAVTATRAERLNLRHPASRRFGVCRALSFNCPDLPRFLNNVDPTSGFRSHLRGGSLAMSTRKSRGPKHPGVVLLRPDPERRTAGARIRWTRTRDARSSSHSTFSSRRPRPRPYRIGSRPAPRSTSATAWRSRSSAYSRDTPRNPTARQSAVS